MTARSTERTEEPAVGGRRRATIPMAWIVALTIVVVVFAALVAAWMYWLAGALA